MDWMGLKTIMKDFDFFGIEIHSIPPNPHELRAKQTSPYNAGKNTMAGTCLYSVSLVLYFLVMLSALSYA
jgi:hypothetical protein